MAQFTWMFQSYSGNLLWATTIVHWIYIVDQWHDAQGFKGHTGYFVGAEALFYSTKYLYWLYHKHWVLVKAKVEESTNPAVARSQPLSWRQWFYHWETTRSPLLKLDHKVSSQWWSVVGNLLHICSYRRPNIIHTERQTHSWLNNVQNVAFLFWSYYYNMVMWEKIPGSPHLHNFTACVPEHGNLETRLRVGKGSGRVSIPVFFFSETGEGGYWLG